MVRTIIKSLLIFLLVLVVLAFVLPFLFKDTIIAKVKTAANENIAARVDFSDVDISFFRHFPRIAVGLNDLQVIGIDEFSEDTLLAAGNLDVAVNLMSVIRGERIVVNSLTLESPRIHAIVMKDGRANWDISKADSTASDTSGAADPFHLEMQHYAITNGYINYRDEKAGMSSEIINLNHSGSGDFSSDLFNLETSTSADAVSFYMGKVPWLVNARTRIDADVQVNNLTNTYQFKTDNISLNDLSISTAGFFQLVDDSTYKMDISFKAPSTQFRSILSLVPVIYQHEFAKVRTEGTAVFNGFVKGTYSSNQIPAYKVNLAVKNGFFQYADLPKPIKNVNFTLKVDNPDGLPDNTVVDLSSAHFEMDNDPFDCRVFLRNPVNNMYIDAAAKGKIDLTRITQFIKLSKGTRLSGLIGLDLTAKGLVSSAEQQQYDGFSAAGKIAVSSLQYASNEYPDGVRINNLFMEFTPATARITDLDGQYKRTNFSANGSINNIIPYVLRDKTLSGNLSLKADHMNVNDWMGTSPDTISKTASSNPPFVVPANLDLAVRAEVGRVLYDKLEIQQLSGNLAVRDQTVKLADIRGNALEGAITINGSYSSRLSKRRPDISFRYDVEKVDVQKTFYALNTVQRLMPIGEYLDGKLSSELQLTGKMGEGMMPDLSSLTGEGNLLLIEGFLRKFAPLEKLGDMLQINEFREISVRDVKNYFEFSNGKVLVKPFTVKVRNVEMEVGGLHGLDQSLDYLINLKLPRSILGSRGNSLVDNLVTQVNSKGIPLKLGETINLHVKLGGTIKSPVLKTDLREAAGNTADQLRQQALDFAKARIDSAKRALTDSTAAIRKQLEKQAEEEIKRRVFGNKDTGRAKPLNADSSRKRIEEAGKGILKELLKKKPVRDSTKTRVKG